jgi:Tfp pilus assembly protein PilO
MKKKTFVFIFLAVHILFIVFQIDKQNRMVRLSYKKQKQEQLQKTLKNKRQELTNKLYALKNKKEIKHFARTQLKMKPLKLKQIKRIKKDECLT